MALLGHRIEMTKLGQNYPFFFCNVDKVLIFYSIVMKLFYFISYQHHIKEKMAQSVEDQHCPLMISDLGALPIVGCCVHWEDVG